VRLAAANSGAPPFAVLTFDDGYRDNLDHALPVLQAHNAPCTVFVTTGFAEGTAPLWWIDLEEAIARQNAVTVDLPSGRTTFAAASAQEKAEAFERIYWALRPGPEEAFRAVVAQLAADAGIDPLARTRALCLDWAGIRTLAADPLVTIGAHTLTHPMLAKHDEAAARAEMVESKRIIEEKLGRDVRHIAYPVGDPGSAGQREFRLARACGFETAVTTRPGMLFAAHAQHLTALPRISVNGLFQRRGDVAALLSGVPTALQNRGRRLNVA
jgi:peptidoglycan/xylan/chitin deacetylase (PgdA/CDA1 family)